jgi:hypothetical protein
MRVRSRQRLLRAGLLKLGAGILCDLCPPIAATAGPA